MPVSGKEMLKRFLKNGWIILRKRSSHIQVHKKGKRKILNETIPLHKELKKGLEKYLLKRMKEE
jgi:predicted RNA binding protein YcfA (HicA-like mRNA interferase family)